MLQPPMPFLFSESYISLLQIQAHTCIFVRFIYPDPFFRSDKRNPPPHTLSLLTQYLPLFAFCYN